MQPLKLETSSASQFVRQELSKTKLSGLTLVETLHAANYTTPPHIHEPASLCLTLAGRGLEISKGTRIVAQPGCVIVRAPQLLHSNQFDAAAHRGFMIELENQWLNSCRHIASVFEGHKYFAGGPVAELALRIYRESRIKDSVAPVIVEGLMLELLGHASRSLIKTPVRAPAWLTQTRDLLHAQFNDQLNLVDIAKTVGVHPTHLARTFKKHYRTTVGDYLRRLRLDWATRQLTETDASIAEIALAAGFYDQSHFSHLFKQHTGFTPAEFRVSQSQSHKR
jgi:AraC family transcriptional regulator